MRYVSTRNINNKFSSAEAISRGLAEEGGLFVPESLPTLHANAFEKLCAMTYQERAVYVMGLFLDDYSKNELCEYTKKAYGTEGFDTPEVAPLYKLDDNTVVLELWHGPTCAFKDMALQMLPYLLTAALKKTGEEKNVCILVATSGDTGKAALEGFCDVDHTKIMVFYPQHGVSDIQKLQMTSQNGNNVGVCAVTGNFDDAQSGVKAIFSDAGFRSELAEKGWFLSSANSINWGRLLPQIVYYISAYCDLINRGDIQNGDLLNFCVPTGNFGNILAGYYAMKMGLPVNKLICASNMNNVLTEFIRTGEYNKNRKFFTTISPSMDILVSSNLERLLFDLSGYGDSETADYMDKLFKTGKYCVSQALKDKLKESFEAGFSTDEETKSAIGDVFKEKGYLMDTHTGVAYDVLSKYRNSTGDDLPCVIVSTASPYKFCDAVLSALGDRVEGSGAELIDRLSKASGTKVPAPLDRLKDSEQRFSDVTDKDEMLSIVRSFLK